MARCRQTRNKIRSTVSVAALTALLALSGTPAVGAGTAVCMRPGDEMAVNIRVMQSEMMVAALACDQAADYNAMVRKFQPDLVAGGAALKQMFRSAYGASAEHHLGRFVTVLANDAAQRSATEQAAFCTEASRVFERVKGMDRSEFRAFVAGAGYADRHGVSLCGARDSAER